MTTDLPLPQWLLKAMSVDVTSLEGGTASFRFARFPDGELGLLALLALAVLFGIVVATYLKEGELARRRKIFMACIRCALLVVMAAILFYPVLEVDRPRDLRAVTLVLVDDSLSMGIVDRYLGGSEAPEQIAARLSTPEEPLDADRVLGLSRAELVNRALSHPEWSLIERLRQANLVRVFTFSDALRAVAAEEDADRPAERIEVVPRGTVTDLASALRGAIEQQGGARVAAVLVFTDGRLTAGEGPAAIGHFLRQRDIPAHAVGVGDPAPSRNLQVTAVLANERVFAGDPITVDARLRQEGYEGETVQLELVEELVDSTGARASPRRVATSDVTFPDDQDEASHAFAIELEGVGRRQLTVRVAARPDETIADDNSRSVTVEVIEEASRVLLVAGAPSFEYRFLKNLLRRDRRVHLAAWLMSADPDFPQEGNESLRKLPDGAAELFEFDVIILLDPDPDGLPPTFPELVERFVGKHGGGLLYVAGEKYPAKFFRSRATRSVAELLPVVPDVTRTESETGKGRFHERSFQLLPTRAASSYPPTRLSSRPERNQDRWLELAGVHWSLPIAKVKPAATVLLDGAPLDRAPGGPDPVLAWQYYEGGRSLFLGTDETWRWRATTEEIYDQFWMQSVRFLTEGRLVGGKRRVLQTDSEEYDLGDAMRISALVEDENYRAVETEFQVVQVEHSQAEPTELRLEPDPAAPGWYRGTFVPRALGEYRFRLADGTETSAAVNPPAIEFRRPQLEEPALRTLGELTGGTYRRLWEAEDLPELIPDQRQTVVTTDEPIPLWDNWLSLGTLAFLLTLEWILRKWNRLL